MPPPKGILGLEMRDALLWYMVGVGLVLCCCCYNQGQSVPSNAKSNIKYQKKDQRVLFERQILIRFSSFLEGGAGPARAPQNQAILSCYFLRIRNQCYDTTFLRRYNPSMDDGQAANVIIYFS